MEKSGQGADHDFEIDPDILLLAPAPPCLWLADAEKQKRAEKVLVREEDVVPSETIKIGWTQQAEKS